ncbi:MAG: alcohol dehydrogenase catalytic domain-containing protein [Acidobacteriota bacterium]
MKALNFDGKLRLIKDAPISRYPDEALVKVICAGICNTDLEIVKGYAGFQGILGHEFVGCVVESPETEFVGKRVVGEINAGCGKCELCLAHDSRHCADRTVLGIKNRNGAFAEYLSLPVQNLLMVPESISNEEAVFVEPFAAACQITEQVEINPETKVAIIGDGKLAQLIARALFFTGCELTVIGKHLNKLSLLKNYATQYFIYEESKDNVGELLKVNLGESFDVVVEATGSATGLPFAIQIVKPKGTIVLKSTHHQKTTIDMSAVVVNEIKIIGSRCGRFQKAIEVMTDFRVDFKSLISKKFPMDAGIEAFQAASQADVMKVIIEM